MAQGSSPPSVGTHGARSPRTPMARSLPVLPGAEHLRFRCTACGECCRTLRAAVTHHDVRRLCEGLARPAAALVEWLAPEAVDMTDEPGSFVELARGRRLMVLATVGGACHLLQSDGRCGAYAHRPRDCRLFPFHLERDEGGRARALERLPFDGCSEETGEPAAFVDVERDDAERWSELADYQARVTAWNRRARLRRRLRHPVGDGDAFLAFLGLGPR